ncbi:MAG: penicillin-binding protein 2 [Chloroflexi bacterium]|nr:penicillin-binding protein 2 [Chloroflexota bacterium]
MSDTLATAAARLAGGLLLAYALLIGMTFYWGFVRADGLAARPDNTRRITFDRRIARGRILDRAGRVLAETRPSPSGEDGDPRQAEASRRAYPYPAAAPVVGFQTWRYGAGGDTRVTYGIGGAEAAYDLALRGDLGLSVRQLLASRVLHRAQRGHDVQLSLDAELQAYAAQLVGDREGAVVVLDVASGAVRALVSLPTFDPEDLDAGGVGDDPTSPLLNRATQGLYTPGSVFKVITLAAALDEGLTSPDQVFADGDAEASFDGFPVACGNNPPGLVRFDLAHAFGYSCNLTFARLGDELGEVRFRAFARRFGIESAPPFPLPLASGQLSPDLPMSRAELVSAAFGQGQTLVTPLQMALVAAAVAGDGSLPVPWLLADVPGQRWAGMADERGTWMRAVGPGTAAQVRRIMQISAEDGYARSAADAAGIAIGGKTGTAQLGGDRAPHSWFVGFAPADRPRLAVAVLVVEGGEGARVAAPIGGQVLARGLQLEAEAGD